MDKKAVGTFVVVSIAFFIFTKISKQCRKLTKRKTTYQISWDDLWNTAIFFPDWFPDQETANTRQLIWYLEQAESKIDVCMFGFSFGMLKHSLMQVAKEKGVRVRILSDRHVRFKKQYGLQTRTKIHLQRNRLDERMFVDLLHHKFVVIDDYAVIAGSQNWTRTSVTENFENVIITSNVRVVTKFSKEFERLWEENLPYNRREVDIMRPC